MAETTTGRGRKSRGAPHSASMRRKGTITIPLEIREQLDLNEGDNFLVSVENDHVVLTPATLISRDQQWYWTPEWQAGEAEADAEYARGEGTTYRSDEEFLASLDAE